YILALDGASRCGNRDIILMDNGAPRLIEKLLVGKPQRGSRQGYATDHQGAQCARLRAVGDGIVEMSTLLRRDHLLRKRHLRFDVVEVHCSIVFRFRQQLALFFLAQKVDVFIEWSSLSGRT